MLDDTNLFVEDGERSSSQNDFKINTVKGVDDIDSITTVLGQSLGVSGTGGEAKPTTLSSGFKKTDEDNAAKERGENEYYTGVIRVNDSPSAEELLQVNELYKKKLGVTEYDELRSLLRLGENESYTDYYAKNKYVPKGYEIQAKLLLAEEKRKKLYAQMEAGQLSEEDFLYQAYGKDILKEQGIDFSSTLYWYNRKKNGDHTDPRDNAVFLAEVIEESRKLFQSEKWAEDRASLDLQLQSLVTGKVLSTSEVASIFQDQFDALSEYFDNQDKILKYYRSGMLQGFNPLIDQDGDGKYDYYYAPDGKLYNVNETGEGANTYKAYYNSDGSLNRIVASDSVGGEWFGSALRSIGRFFTDVVDFGVLLGSAVVDFVDGGEFGDIVADAQATMGQFWNTKGLVKDTDYIADTGWKTNDGDLNIAYIGRQAAGLAGTIAAMWLTGNIAKGATALASKTAATKATTEVAAGAAQKAAAKGVKSKLSSMLASKVSAKSVGKGMVNVTSRALNTAMQLTSMSNGAFAGTGFKATFKAVAVSSLRDSLSTIATLSVNKEMLDISDDQIVGTAFAMGTINMGVGIMLRGMGSEGAVNRWGKVFAGKTKTFDEAGKIVLENASGFSGAVLKGIYKKPLAIGIMNTVADTIENYVTAATVSSAKSTGELFNGNAWKDIILDPGMFINSLYQGYNTLGDSTKFKEDRIRGMIGDVEMLDNKFLGYLTTTKKALAEGEGRLKNMDQIDAINDVMTQYELDTKSFVDSGASIAEAKLRALENVVSGTGIVNDPDHPFIVSIRDSIKKDMADMQIQFTLAAFEDYNQNHKKKADLIKDSIQNGGDINQGILSRFVYGNHEKTAKFFAEQMSKYVKFKPEDILTKAGFRKGADGKYVDPTSQALSKIAKDATATVDPSTYKVEPLTTFGDIKYKKNDLDQDIPYMEVSDIKKTLDLDEAEALEVQQKIADVRDQGADLSEIQIIKIDSSMQGKSKEQQDKVNETESFFDAAITLLDLGTPEGYGKMLVKLKNGVYMVAGFSDAHVALSADHLGAFVRSVASLKYAIHNSHDPEQAVRALECIFAAYNIGVADKSLLDLDYLAANIDTIPAIFEVLLGKSTQNAKPILTQTEAALLYRAIKNKIAEINNAKAKVDPKDPQVKMPEPAQAGVYKDIVEYETFITDLQKTKSAIKDYIENKDTLSQAKINEYEQLARTFSKTYFENDENVHSAKLKQAVDDGLATKEEYDQFQNIARNSFIASQEASKNLLRLKSANSLAKNILDDKVRTTVTGVLEKTFGKWTDKDFLTYQQSYIEQMLQSAKDKNKLVFEKSAVGYISQKILDKISLEPSPLDLADEGGRKKYAAAVADTLYDELRETQLFNYLFNKGKTDADKELHRQTLKDNLTSIIEGVIDLDYRTSPDELSISLDNIKNLSAIAMAKFFSDTSNKMYLEGRWVDNPEIEWGTLSKELKFTVQSPEELDSYFKRLALEYTTGYFKRVIAGMAGPDFNVDNAIDKMITSWRRSTKKRGNPVDLITYGTEYINKHITPMYSKSMKELVDASIQRIESFRKKVPTIQKDGTNKIFINLDQLQGTYTEKVYRRYSSQSTLDTLIKDRTDLSVIFGDDSEFKIGTIKEMNHVNRMKSLFPSGEVELDLSNSDDIETLHLILDPLYNVDGDILSRGSEASVPGIYFNGRNTEGYEAIEFKNKDGVATVNILQGLKRDLLAYAKAHKKEFKKATILDPVIELEILSRLVASVSDESILNPNSPIVENFLDLDSTDDLKTSLDMLGNLLDAIDIKNGKIAGNKAKRFEEALNTITAISQTNPKVKQAFFFRDAVSTLADNYDSLDPTVITLTQEQYNFYKKNSGEIGKLWKVVTPDSMHIQPEMNQGIPLYKLTLTKVANFDKESFKASAYRLINKDGFEPIFLFPIPSGTSEADTGSGKNLNLNNGVKESPITTSKSPFRAVVTALETRYSEEYITKILNKNELVLIKGDLDKLYKAAQESMSSGTSGLSVKEFIDKINNDPDAKENPFIVAQLNALLAFKEISNQMRTSLQETFGDVGDTIFAVLANPDRRAAFGKALQSILQEAVDKKALDSYFNADGYLNITDNFINEVEQRIKTNSSLIKGEYQVQHLEPHKESTNLFSPTSDPATLDIAKVQAQQAASVVERDAKALTTAEVKAMLELLQDRITLKMVDKSYATLDNPIADLYYSLKASSNGDNLSISIKDLIEMNLSEKDLNELTPILKQYFSDDTIDKLKTAAKEMYVEDIQPDNKLSVQQSEILSASLNLEEGMTKETFTRDQALDLAITKRKLDKAKRDLRKERYFKSSATIKEGTPEGVIMSAIREAIFKDVAPYVSNKGSIMLQNFNRLEEFDGFIDSLITTTKMLFSSINETSPDSITMEEAADLALKCYFYSTGMEMQAAYPENIILKKVTTKDADGVEHTEYMIVSTVLSESKRDPFGVQFLSTITDSFMSEDGKIDTKDCIMVSLKRNAITSSYMGKIPEIYITDLSTDKNRDVIQSQLNNFYANVLQRLDTSGKDVTTELANATLKKFFSEVGTTVKSRYEYLISNYEDSGSNTNNLFVEGFINNYLSNTDSINNASERNTRFDQIMEAIFRNIDPITQARGNDPLEKLDSHKTNLDLIHLNEGILFGTSLEELKTHTALMDYLKEVTTNNENSLKKIIEDNNKTKGTKKTWKQAKQKLDDCKRAIDRHDKEVLLANLGVLSEFGIKGEHVLKYWLTHTDNMKTKMFLLLDGGNRSTLERRYNEETSLLFWYDLNNKVKEKVSSSEVASSYKLVLDLENLYKNSSDSGHIYQIGYMYVDGNDKVVKEGVLYFPASNMPKPGDNIESYLENNYNEFYTKYYQKNTGSKKSIKEWLDSTMSIDDAKAELTRLLQQAQKDNAFIIGFNSDPFDIPKLADSGYIDSSKVNIYNLRSIDLMKWDSDIAKYSSAKVGKGERTLDATARRHGIDVGDSHDAVSDIHATYELFKKMLSDDIITSRKLQASLLDDIRDIEKVLGIKKPVEFDKELVDLTMHLQKDSYNDTRDSETAYIANLRSKLNNPDRLNDAYQFLRTIDYYEADKKARIRLKELDSRLAEDRSTYTFAHAMSDITRKTSATELLSYKILTSMSEETRTKFLEKLSDIQEARAKKKPVKAEDLKFIQETIIESLNDTASILKEQQSGSKKEIMKLVAKDKDILATTLGINLDDFNSWKQDNSDLLTTFNRELRQEDYRSIDNEITSSVFLTTEEYKFYFAMEPLMKSLDELASIKGLSTSALLNDLESELENFFDWNADMLEKDADGKYILPSQNNNIVIDNLSKEDRALLEYITSDLLPEIQHPSIYRKVQAIPASDTVTIYEDNGKQIKTHIKPDTLYMSPESLCAFFGITYQKGEVYTKDTFKKVLKANGIKSDDIYVPVIRHPLDKPDSLIMMKVELLTGDDANLKMICNIDTFRTRFNGDFDGDAIMPLRDLTKGFYQLASNTWAVKSEPFTLFQNALELAVSNKSFKEIVKSDANYVVHDEINNSGWVANRISQDINAIIFSQNPELVWARKKEQFITEMRSKYPTASDEFLESIYLVSPINISHLTSSAKNKLGISNNRKDITCITYSNCRSLRQSFDSDNNKLLHAYTTAQNATLGTISKSDTLSGKAQKNKMIGEDNINIPNIKWTESAIVLTDTTRNMIDNNAQLFLDSMIDTLKNDTSSNTDAAFNYLYSFREKVYNGKASLKEASSVIEIALKLIQINTIEGYQKLYNDSVAAYIEANKDSPAAAKFKLFSSVLNDFESSGLTDAQKDLVRFAWQTKRDSANTYATSGKGTTVLQDLVNYFLADHTTESKDPSRYVYNTKDKKYHYIDENGKDYGPEANIQNVTVLIRVSNKTDSPEDMVQLGNAASTLKSYKMRSSDDITTKEIALANKILNSQSDKPRALLDPKNKEHKALLKALGVDIDSGRHSYQLLKADDGTITFVDYSGIESQKVTIIGSGASKAMIGGKASDFSDDTLKDVVFVYDSNASDNLKKLTTGIGGFHFDVALKKSKIEKDPVTGVEYRKVVVPMNMLEASVFWNQDTKQTSVEHLAVGNNISSIGGVFLLNGTLYQVNYNDDGSVSHISFASDEYNQAYKKITNIGRNSSLMHNGYDVMLKLKGAAVMKSLQDRGIKTVTITGKKDIPCAKIVDFIYSKYKFTDAFNDVLDMVIKEYGLTSSNPLFNTILDKKFLHTLFNKDQDFSSASLTANKLSSKNSRANITATNATFYHDKTTSAGRTAEWYNKNTLAEGESNRYIPMLDALNALYEAAGIKQHIDYNTVVTLDKQGKLNKGFSHERNIALPFVAEDKKVRQVDYDTKIPITEAKTGETISAPINVRNKNSFLGAVNDQARMNVYTNDYMVNRQAYKDKVQGGYNGYNRSLKDANVSKEQSTNFGAKKIYAILKAIQGNNYAEIAQNILPNTFLNTTYSQTSHVMTDRGVELDTRSTIVGSKGYGEVYSYIKDTSKTPDFYKMMAEHIESGRNKVMANISNNTAGIDEAMQSKEPASVLPTDFVKPDTNSQDYKNRITTEQGMAAAYNKIAKTTIAQNIDDVVSKHRYSGDGGTYKSVEYKKWSLNNNIDITKENGVEADRIIHDYNTQHANIQRPMEVELVDLKNTVAVSGCEAEFEQYVYITSILSKLERIRSEKSALKNQDPNDPEYAEYLRLEEQTVNSLVDLPGVDSNDPIKSAQDFINVFRKVYTDAAFYANKLMTRVTELSMYYSKISGEPSDNLFMLLPTTTHNTTDARNAAAKYLIKVLLGSNDVVKQKYNRTSKTTDYIGVEHVAFDAYNFFDSMATSISNIARQATIIETADKLKKQGFMSNAFITQTVLTAFGDGDTIKQAIATKKLSSNDYNILKTSADVLVNYLNEIGETDLAHSIGRTFPTLDPRDDSVRASMMASIYLSAFEAINKRLGTSDMSYEEACRILNTGDTANIAYAEAKRVVSLTEVSLDLVASIDDLISKKQSDDDMPGNVRMVDLLYNKIISSIPEGTVIVDKYGRPQSRDTLFALSDHSFEFANELISRGDTEYQYKGHIVELAMSGQLYLMNSDLNKALCEHVFIKKNLPKYQRILKNASGLAIKLLMSSPFKIIDRVIKYTMFDVASLSTADAGSLLNTPKAFTEMRAYFASKGAAGSEDLKEFMATQGYSFDQDSLGLLSSDTEFSGKNPFKTYTDAVGNVFDMQTMATRYAYWLSAKNKLSGDEPDYSVLGSAYYLRPQLESLEGYTDRSGQVITKEGRQAAFAMSQILGSPKDFPSMSKKLGNYGFVFTSFPLAAARWGVGEFRSLSYALKDIFAGSATSGQSVQWLKRNSMGIIGTFIAEQMLIGLICDMFGIDEEQEEEWQESGALPNVTQTFMQDSPIMDTFSSMNPARELYSMTAEPFVSSLSDDDEESSVLTGFQKSWYKHVVGHINPFIKNAGEVITGKDIIDDKVINTKGKYNGFENVSRKLFGYIIGAAGSNALINAFNDNKDLDFGGQLVSGVKSALAAETGNTKVYKSNIKNYYKSLGLLNEYLYSGSTYNDRELSTTFNYDRYKTLKKEISKLIYNESKITNSYELIEKYLAKGYTAQEIKAAFLNYSIAGKLDKIGTEEAIYSLFSGPELQNIKSALAFEKNMYPWLYESTPTLNDVIADSYTKNYDDYEKQWYAFQPKKYYNTNKPTYKYSSNYNKGSYRNYRQDSSDAYWNSLYTYLYGEDDE